jgi:ABC transporter with metal-binding/Fe-S-binding domain ATP-binding protein
VLVRVGVLYSGGKDSNLALLKASREHSVVCLITLRPRSVESMLYHYPNVELVELQAEALGLPLVTEESPDDEEGGLEALRRALLRAAALYGIEGVVTGAVKSRYQASRFEAVARSLGLSCLNPLWGRDELELLREVVASGIVAIFTRVAGYPLGRVLLGRKLDEEAIELLARLRGYVNPSGEGGEYETFVLDSPLFRKRVVPLEWRIVGSEYDATLLIERAVLAEKQH